MPVVLIAPDKFKGSLSAPDVAAALARGLTAARPDVEVRLLPVADGGEGTLAAAVVAGFERVPVTATGPTGLPVDTAYARRGDLAVVEMADVSGLARLPGGRTDALRATSRGTGEVVAAAVAAGCTRIVLGVGGSACTDGGAGLVQALGARLLDADGRELPPGGAALTALHTLDATGLVRDVELVVACDVDNPLTGVDGAARVYGPQKGASPSDVELLHAALAHWADVVEATTGHDRRDDAGAGAAGGTGFAAIALLGAQLRPGIALLLDLLDVDRHLQGADLVVVGEGSLDEQSLRGKAPVGVAQAAARVGARVVAVSGRRSIDDDQLRAAGISSAYALTDLEADPQACMAEAAVLLERVGAGLADEL